MKNTAQQLSRKVKRLILLFIIGLCLSGITAFPLLQEISFLYNKISPHAPAFIQVWITKVYNGIKADNSSYPFMAYGTDWLAFAHLMLAVLFAGAVKDPVRNKWVVEFGIIASACIFPLAFIAGEIRGIPVFWRLIDCSFGVVTLVILLPCYRMIRKLQGLRNEFL